MRRKNGLNPSALRGGVTGPRDGNGGPRRGAANLSEDGPRFSRREVIGLAGATVVGASPALRTLESGILGPFEMKSSSKRAALRLGGRDRWIIDARLFAGSPALRVERTGNRIHIELAGARFPGTALPADFVCDLRPALIGWKMDLEMALGGFRAGVPFERWLAGAEAARSPVSLNAPVCEIRAGAPLRLEGRAVAEFRPDWSLRLEGPGLARLPEFGKTAVADSVEIALPKHGETSYLRNPPRARTLLTLWRGEHTWAWEPPAIDSGFGRLVTDSSPFDVLRIEAGETRSGSAARVLVAESGGGRAALFFEPFDAPAGAYSTPFRIPLRDVRYARALGDGARGTALTAQFHSDPVWLHTRDCSLLLGDPGDSSVFELSGGHGGFDRVRCVPALLAVSAPMAGAVVESTRAPEGARMEFTRAEAPPRIAEPNVGQVRAIPRIRAPIAVLPSNLTVSIVRPDDLLNLRFEFVNLTLKTGGAPGARLERADPKQPAYIVVHFPAQNIAERAFFQSAGPDYPVARPPGAPADPDQGKSASDPLVPPPVASRIAGPSRLVFSVPDSTSSIPYTLDALLDWSKYELSVAPTAVASPGRTIFLPSALERRDVVRYNYMPLSAKFQPKAEAAETVRNFVAIVNPRAAAEGLTRVGPARAGISAVGLVGAILQPPKIEEPAPTQTAIECPYRLILSPSQLAGWAHSVSAVTHDGITELWHTRLAIRTNDGKVLEGIAGSRTLRAIWSPDCRPDDPSDGPGHVMPQWPFRMSLDGQDRHEIVHLTANYRIPDYRPSPVNAERFMLSALGAWMNTRGAWGPPLNLTVEEWRHLATMARDHYVRVVYKGYLFPFGHRASLVKITERKFELTPDGYRAAYLRQRMYIVVRQPEKLFGASGLQTPEGDSIDLQMPFKRVRIGTLVTPDLDPPENTDIGGMTLDGFWPFVGKSPFQFHLIGEDPEGQATEFTAPLIFVSSRYSDDAGKMGQVLNDYRVNANLERRERPLQGQKVAFAESTPGKPGDTTFEVESIRLSAFVPGAGTQLPADQPRFFPVMERARAHLTAIEQVAGQGQAADVEFHASYLKAGFDEAANKGAVFLRLLSSLPLDFGAGGHADKAGGLVTPNMSIGGLSRALGPVGGVVDNLVNGLFDPSDFFSDAKIFGGMLLSSIIPKINPSDFNLDTTKALKTADDVKKLLDTGGSRLKVPFLTSRVIRESNDPLAKPTGIETTFAWKPDLKSFPESQPIFVTKDGTELVVTSTLLTKLDGTPPTFDIKGSIKSFDMDLIAPVVSFIRIEFKKLEFTAKTGQKANVGVDIEAVHFAGPLSFVNALQEFLKSTGEGPSIDIQPSGVTAGLTIAIPNVAVGVMSLENLSLSASLHIPFNSDPLRIEFAFCSRENPFHIIVSMFGGGGFFGIRLGLDGVEQLEASLEFGGSFSLDIGVASGGVHIMAGIYFKLESKPGGSVATLTGYLRCGGSLEVLGIITVSVEFYMGLTYESEGNKVWGEASLTVEIEILFFSASVELSVRREFAGSAADPSFSEMITQPQWEDYCDAFAA